MSGLSRGDGPLVADVLNFIRNVTVIARTVPSLGYRWRPMLSDPDDDMVLECASASRSNFLVTRNVRDFTLKDHAFGFEVVTPSQFIAKLKR